MPCNSDYMEATNQEREISRVACLIDELNGQTFNPSHWHGYHPQVYCQPYDADLMTKSLCERLQKVEISDYSLEMQMWWRDHKIADRERLARELAETEDKDARKAAIAKLTSHERRLLGLDPPDD